MRPQHSPRTLLVSLFALLMFSSCAADPPVLDAAGRSLLDPLRAEELRPDALLARLGLGKHAVVADVGAGPGFLTLPLARAVPQGRVVATDIRVDYLEILRGRAKEASLDNITTVVVDADHPGLPANAVDLVLLCQVDHYLRDRTQFLIELSATLRAEGRIAVVNFNRYRQAILAAADHASLEVVDDWQLSPGMFTIIFRSRRPR